MPDVVGGFGTAAAFIFGVGAYAYDKWRARQRQRRQQAVLFDAWVAEVRQFHSPLKSTIQLKVMFSNSSAHAVRSVGIEFFCGPGARTLVQERFGTIPPTNASGLVERWVIVEYPPDETYDVGESGENTTYTTFATSFTDAGGMEWTRHGSGALIEHSPRAVRRAQRRWRSPRRAKRRWKKVKRRLAISSAAPSWRSSTSRPAEPIS